MIDRSHDLPITRQAKVLNVSRGSVYYLPRAASAADLALMRRIDELHLDFPFAGSRMLRDLLIAEGFRTGRRHVATLMKRMGIQAVYRKPTTSKPAPGHKIYPYLLRDLAVTRPNQVWAMDLTSVPMARGFVSLAAVIDWFSRDWFSRRVLAWRLSITMEATMEAGFCVEAVEEALACHGKPEIFNTDQGSQFTSAAFTGLLTDNAIAISMDGRGAWRDNVFVERLWRSVKYEEIYLKAYQTVAEARTSIASYFGFYNSRRPHSSLIRALTGKHPIRPTSPRFRRSRQPEPGRRSTYQPKYLFRQAEPPHSAKHQADHGQSDEGDASSVIEFMIANEAPTP
jgi:putative transposase